MVSGAVLRSGPLAGRPRVLLIWPEDHPVWRGYFDLLDNAYDLTVAFTDLKKTDVLLRNPALFLQSSTLRIRGLRAAIEKVRPDVIIVYHLFDPTSWQTLSLARKRKIPVVILESMHLAPQAWRRRPKRSVQLLFKLLAPLVRRRFNSRYAGKDARLCCMIPRSAVFMRSLGLRGVEEALIPYSGFAGNVRPAKAQAMRAKGTSLISGKGKKFTLLYVGRFTEMKNLFLLLDAVRSLRDAGAIAPSAFELSLVGGDGEERAAVLAYIETHRLNDIVVFHGNKPRAELIAHYASADLFVLPSFDVLGAVTLEALEHGLPVLIADQSGFSTLCARHADRLVFRQNDAADFVEKLRWCLEHRASLKKMGAAIREDFLEKERRGRADLCELIDGLAVHRL